MLYIPYQPVSPVVTTFAGDEDTYANNNIQYIPASLQKCASPGFFYTANTPTEITACAERHVQPRAADRAYYELTWQGGADAALK